METGGPIEGTSLKNVNVLETNHKGAPFYYPEHSLIGEYIAAGESWDGVLVPILSSVFEPSSKPVIAEVGTNIAGSLLQMEAALPQATFFCFEPTDRFIEIAKRNIKANNWSNVTLENLFLSDKKGEININTNSSTASAAVTEYREDIPELKYIDTQKVPTITLDEYFTDPSRTVDFLKVDTDGYEPQVLKGAENVLKRDKPFIFMEFDPRLLSQAGANPEELLFYLQGLGYEDFLIFSNFGEALAVEKDPKAVLNHANKAEYYVDLLAVNASRPSHNSLTDLNKQIGSNYKMKPLAREQ